MSVIDSATQAFNKIDQNYSQELKNLRAGKTVQSAAERVSFDSRMAENNAVTIAAATIARYHVNSANRVRAEMAARKGIKLPHEVDTYA
jgi:hypothetical protein